MSRSKTKNQKSKIPLISIIAAMSENRVIGRDNTLPWRLPADLKRFKALTSGHPIVMGRKTWQSIGRPLPNRRNIVITRDRGFAAEGAIIVHGLHEALRRCEGEEEVFIIGGEEIYRQALPLADRIYLTLVHAIVEGDTKFPAMDEGAWELVERDRHEPDGPHGDPYSFLRFERLTAGSAGKTG